MYLIYFQQKEEMLTYSPPINALRNQGFFYYRTVCTILSFFLSTVSGAPLGHRYISVLFLPMNKNDYQ